MFHKIPFETASRGEARGDVKLRSAWIALRPGLQFRCVLGIGWDRKGTKMSKVVLVMGLWTFGSLMAADASGRWAGTLETNSGPVQIFLTLHHGQGALSGTISTEDETNRVPIEPSGDVLTFEVHDNANRIVKFRLTLTYLLLIGEAGVDDRVSKVSFWRADLISEMRTPVH